MKNIIVVLLIFLVTSCSSSGGLQGNPAAIQLGASVGGIIGAVVGDNLGGYNGSAVGSIVGTITGAVIGNAATSPKNNDFQEEYIEIYRENGYVPKEGSTLQMEENQDLRIRNLRFIDENRNQVIDPNEKSKIIFEIVNEGNAVIHHIVPEIVEVSGIKDLRISPPREINILEPGAKVKYTATVQTGKKLKDGTATFRIRACDENGFCSPAREFSVSTRKKDV